MAGIDEAGRVMAGTALGQLDLGDLPEPHAHRAAADRDILERLLHRRGDCIGPQRAGKVAGGRLGRKAERGVEGIRTINAFERVSPALSGLARRVGHGLRRNTRRRARDNIRAHYDLSNDFFGLFLDPSMMYLGAIYPGEQATLGEGAV